MPDESKIETLIPAQSKEISTPLQTSELKIGKLRELKKMLDENLINKEEYDIQKTKILNE
jgi:hypothetical protein